MVQPTDEEVPATRQGLVSLSLVWLLLHIVVRGILEPQPEPNQHLCIGSVES